MTPEIGQKVDVGGCVGGISAINAEEILVEGTFFYTDGMSGVDAEFWSFVYDRSAFASAPWDRDRWDASSIKPISK